MSGMLAHVTESDMGHVFSLGLLVAVILLAAIAALVVAYSRRG